MRVLDSFLGLLGSLFCLQLLDWSRDHIRLDTEYWLDPVLDTGPLRLQVSRNGAMIGNPSKGMAKLGCPLKDHVNTGKPVQDRKVTVLVKRTIVSLLL